jgi:hypothetical protein
MSSRRAALVLAFAALSGGAIGACGGGDTLTDSVPKSTPDLTVPRDASALAPASTTSTTGSNNGGTPSGGFSDFCQQNPGACGQ